MSTLDRAVNDLQSERSRLERELQLINAALSTLSNLNGAGRGRGRGRRVGTAIVRSQRHMFASARRRIAAAQRG